MKVFEGYAMTQDRLTDEQGKSLTQEPECDHDWRWVDDWYGDPDVINGTADCSRWRCRLCDAEDHEREPPSERPEDFL